MHCVPTARCSEVRFVHGGAGPGNSAKAGCPGPWPVLRVVLEGWGAAAVIMGGYIRLAIYMHGHAHAQGRGRAGAR